MKNGILTVAVLIVMSSLPVFAETIEWQVVSGGGTEGASTSYQLGGTVGQTAVGPGTTTAYAVNSGYWQNFNEGNCCLEWGLPGDANSDGAINLLDVLWIIGVLYQEPFGEPHNPNGCDALMDANGDGISVTAPVINLLDVLALIAHIYQDPIGQPILCCPPGCQTP
ncbi:MAG: hypothetical protein JW763_08800 [candidate division Zixibacteria bacterium]|nr:hypothetical protein [candidate division Zixibacteria bacterium]